MTTDPSVGDPARPYDAVLLLSFGGPERLEDVMPFLRQVTAGRGIPDERLAVVGEHYVARGGKSPVNDLGRALAAALRTELAARGADLPVELGNRNWAPWAADTLRELHDGGARRVVTVLTSAYSSYSSCRQYREDLAGAQGTLADEGRSVTLDKVRPYWSHPGFADTMADLVADTVAAIPAERHATTHVAYVTHSIPTWMQESSGPPDDPAESYQAQHERLAARCDEVVRRRATALPSSLVYCSRSGPPQQPWLEPDVNDHLESLAAAGATDVVLAPIGFVSDHMEVVHDLDTEAAATARRLGITAHRVPTVGTHPAFVAGLADLVLERAAQARGEQPDRPAVDGRPLWSTCPRDCCLGRAPRAALCGADG
ncbi:ferrochelatase [Arsenicicoccus sp. oral taxon 190]|uniref:ferrochelatase n=1 Tax=Arsenicicoccus sp. oral taxon 190 TaxID=1658671 RepID=UPI00067A29ED|nr:ferrochelatase [Arsenicicoccus sp. oral taxon 190]AKT52013.1 ferrochelatase [Arsenicicoccus sp. oral taxon 190]